MKLFDTESSQSRILDGDNTGTMRGVIDETHLSKTTQVRKTRQHFRGFSLVGQNDI